MIPFGLLQIKALKFIWCVDSYQDKLESKLGALQNELLTPIRNYTEEFLKIKIPVHYDLSTTELPIETANKLYDFFNSFVNLYI